MKVVHIVSGALSGGAARGAVWLHRALLNIGLNSSILSNDVPHGDDLTIVSIVTTKREDFAQTIKRQLDRLPYRFYRHSQKTVFSTGMAGYPIHKHPAVRDADIVNLHWINNGFVNLMDLEKITKPIVWTLRDMWPMTGGCHYALDCNRYKERCGKCPQLNSRIKYDLSYMIIRRKMKALLKVNLTAVGISNWISECARESALFMNKRVRMISNTIDLSEFQRVDKSSARRILGLPKKKCILVGAQSLLDGYKGMNEFVKALQKLPRRETLHLLAFGGRSDAALKKAGVELTSLGFLHDAPSLRLAYSAADVFVAPAKSEAFGKTLVEAMACGTPVVAFDATGPKDIVDHQMNGYLARPFEAADLANGIEWVLDHPDPERLSWEARRKCEQAFAPDLIAKKYSDLYSEILS